MKKIIAIPFIIAFAIIALIIGFSCKKKTESKPEETPVTPTGNTSNINGFFSSNTTPALSFTVNVTSSQTITGTGAQIIIPPNAFVTKSTGSPVTGTVQISLIEIYTKKGMILNKAQTMTSSDLLNSAGELNLKVMQGAVDLKLGPGKQLAIKILEPVSPQSGMLVFNGAINTNSLLVWTVSPSTPSVVTQYDSTSIGGGYYYNFNCDSLGWINCDMFNGSTGPKTTFTITLTGSHDKSNTVIFTAFPSINGVTQLYCGTTNLQAFGHWGQVPIGINATIVAISEINGQYYSAFVPTTITASMTSAVTLTATTNAAILTQLNSL